MQRSRAWRRHQENRVINNRMRQLKEHDPERAELYEDQKHMLSKSHAFGCGNARCPICHPYKNYQDGNHKDFHYYKRHPEELDEYLLEPDESYEDYDYGLEDDEAA